jgi:hypothetical protein
MPPTCHCRRDGRYGTTGGNVNRASPRSQAMAALARQGLGLQEVPRPRPETMPETESLVLVDG